jgi:hypothetical protein
VEWLTMLAKFLGAQRAREKSAGIFIAFKVHDERAG